MRNQRPVIRLLLTPLTHPPAFDIAPRSRPDGHMQMLKGHWQLIAVTALVFALWHTPLVLPLKIFVVFLHELSHGLAAVLTGGRIEEMSISAQQGGHAITRGGNGFVILSAGYVGSLVLGALLLTIALRTHLDRAMVALCGAVMLGVTALYIRDGFAMAFCGVGGLALLAMARFLPRDINDMMLRIMGLTSLIYVPYDIFDDTIARSGLRSDARMLAEQYGGTTLMWGGLWLFLSLVVIGFFLRYGLGPSSNLHRAR